MAVTKRKRKGKLRPGQRSSYYQVEVYVGGVRVARETFETQAAAAVWHDKTKARFDQGRGPVGELTISDAMISYREREFAALSPGSQLNAEKSFRIIGRSPLAQVQLADLSGHSVDLFLEHLIASPLARNPQRKSFLRELGALRTLLNFYRDQFDDRFVLPLTRRHFKRARFKGALPSRRKDFFLPPADATLWLHQLRTAIDPVYADLALFQLIMGARVGEAAALQWDAVDLEAGRVEIRRTMDWRNADGTACAIPGDHTKTHGSRRTLPLPPVVAELLRTARRRWPHSPDVFRNKAGRPLAYNSIWNNYTRAFRLAGLPWTATHICRHTNATLASSELSPTVVQDHLGHQSARQTASYVHPGHEENGVPHALARMLEVQDHVPDHVPAREALIRAIETRGLKVVEDPS